MKQARFALLDGLRGFAAVSVVLFHLGHWLDIPMLAGNSSLAVDLFFCLIGFVLPFAYGRRSQPKFSAKTFFSVRLTRLMPLIFVATMISGGYVYAHMLVTHDRRESQSLILAILLSALSLPYRSAPAWIGGPQVFPFNGPQFTLFFELFVNVIWFFLRGVYPRFLPMPIAAICAFVIVFFGLGGDNTANFWLGFPRVGASFFLGVTLFELQTRCNLSAQIRLAFWPLGILMIVVFYFPEAFGRLEAILWITLVGPGLVLCGSKMIAGGMLERICFFSGEISYPISVLSG